MLALYLTPYVEPYDSDEDEDEDISNLMIQNRINSKTQNIKFGIM